MDRGTYSVKHCASHARDPAVTALLLEIAPDLVAEALYFNPDTLVVVTAGRKVGL